MIFSVATTLKEHAEALLHERASAIERELEASRRKEEEKEMEKFRGTQVTRERFMEWSVRFKEEAEAARRKAVAEREEEEKGRRGAVKEKRLTGGFSLCFG